MDYRICVRACLENELAPLAIHETMPSAARGRPEILVVDRDSHQNSSAGSAKP